MSAGTLGQAPQSIPKLLVAALILLAALAGLPSLLQAQPGAPPVEIHVYSEPGCPYCQQAKAFLSAQKNDRNWLEIIDHNIESDAAALEQFEKLNEQLKVDQAGVPLILVGAKSFIGFDSPQTTGAEIIAAAEQCRAAPCRNLHAELSLRAPQPEGGSTEQAAEDTLPAARRPDMPERLSLPILGEVETAKLSLPLLTVLLAAVDGFNPCAMWVLVFLIGLLLGMEDRTRMWILGGAFLITSALVYFVFLAAWLNVFLFLGALLWIRLLVGGFSLASGVYYLREFALNPEGACKVTKPGSRRSIMDALKRSIQEKHFWPALAGVIVLAAAVNLIELLCSAGLPAVFTNVLSMSDLPLWQYYAYLMLYIGVFLADDAIIFVTAMVTLHATGLTATYSRYSHLIGGTALLIVGALLIFRPDLLAFG